MGVHVRVGERGRERKGRKRTAVSYATPLTLQLPTPLATPHSSDVPLEYCGEDQAISCVGMAAPRPGVFLPAIR